MDSNDLDRIHIRDLKAECVLGVYEEERNVHRQVVFNLTLFFHGPAGAIDDDFDRAVDYDAASRQVVELTRRSSFRLIESLAEATASLLLSIPGVAACRVVVDKPGIPRNSRSAAVEIYRKNSGGFTKSN